MKTTCEFRFGFWDVTASGDASLAASENQSFADVDDVKNEDGIDVLDVATLEPGFGWPLDGSKSIMPDDPESYTWGWWSTQLSSAGGAFSSPPSLTTTFSGNHSSAGITLTFFGTLPLLVNIKWYDLSDSLLADETYAPDSFTYFCARQVEDYGKVVITVHSMQYEDRYLRVTRVLFGALVVLDAARVRSAKVTEEVDPSLLTLPISKLALSFYTADGSLDLLEPGGAYTLFQTNQEFVGYATVDGERRLMGKYYHRAADGADEAVTDIDGEDAFGVLDRAEFNGGIYVDEPLEDLLDALLTPEGIDFTADAAFTGVTLTGYLPICKKRAALQQVVFTVGALPLTVRREGLAFVPVPSAATAAITPTRKIKGHNVKQEDLITQVDVTAHQYTLETDCTQLSKSALAAGEHTITFGSPVSVTAASGATITEAHPNYCVVQVASGGDVILSGYRYTDATTVYTAKTDPLPAGAKNSVKSIDRVTLIDPGKAAGIASRLLAYYQNRYTDEGKILPGDEVTGEVAELSSLGGQSITGHIRRMVIDLSGGYISSIVIRGQKT